MAEPHRDTLVAVAWPTGEPTPAVIGVWAAAGWRPEPVLPDQEALDRAGSKGRTPPPFQTLLWHPDPPDADPTPLPERLDEVAQQWGALRLATHPAWDDTADPPLLPGLKQVSFLKAQAGLTDDGFRRHFREHVAVARVHHPAICRYVQHDVLATEGRPPLDVQGVSELWFPDESAMVQRYFAGPDSVAVVRADNREYIDFSGTLSLLVEPVDGRAG